MDQDISTAILTTLQAIRDNNNPVFKDILERATNQFTGFPSLTITSSDVGSEFATTKENLRMYRFFITCYVRDDTEASWQQTRRLSSIIRDALDESNDLGQSQWIVEPAQLDSIENEVIGNGEHLKATISVIIKAVKNV